MEQPLTALGIVVKEAETDLLPILLRARAIIEKKIKTASKNPKIGSSAKERQKLFKAIDEAYKELSSDLDGWTESQAKGAMRTFFDRAKADLPKGHKSQSITEFSEKHTAEIFAKVNPGNVSGRVAISDAHIRKLGSMRDSDIRILREAFVEEFRANSLLGLPARELQKNLMESVQRRFAEIAEKGTDAWQFIDRSGRKWKTSNYFNMVVRTNSREVANQSYMDGLQDEGFDLVSIQGGGDPCPTCARWRGVIVSVSGNDKRFPSYADSVAAGVWHPNCVCQTVYVDEDDAEVEEQANTPNPKEPTKEEWSTYSKRIQDRQKDKESIFQKRQSEKADRTLDKELKEAETEEEVKAAQGVDDA